MNRSPVRALALLAAFLLIIPSIASIGVRQTLAQDATPVPADVVTPAPLAEAMPPDTVAYVAAEVDPSNDQFTQLSSLLAQLVIPGAGDTVSAIVEQIVSLLAKIPSDLRTVLTGEIGVGIAELGGIESMLGGSFPGYVVVLHPLEAGDARGVVETWFTDQVEKSGGSVVTTVNSSTKILTGVDLGEEAGSLPTTLAFVGDYILLGQSAEAMAPYIAAIQGGGSSLASSEELELLNGALPSERLMFGYVDPVLLKDAVGGLDFAGVSIDSIDSPFGTTAFTVAADDAGLRLESATIPLDLGIGSIDRPGENPDFASSVPDSTLALLAGKDLGSSWAIWQLQQILLATLVSAMGGGDMDLSDFSVEDQFGFLAMLSGINFKTDLFDQFSGDYGAALFSLDTDDPMASSAVIATELGTPDIVSVAVTSLGPVIQSAGAGMASVTTASIDGQTVNNVTLSTDSINGTIQYGVVDDELMIGLGNGIETIAVEPSATLADSAHYQAALAELPADYDSVVYLDTQSLADVLVPLLMESMAEGSTNALVECLAGTTETTEATPTAEDSDTSLGGWALDTGCSVLNGLLGGDGALLDLIVNRVPGPFAAVSYEQDGLQRASGILLVGSSDS